VATARGKSGLRRAEIKVREWFAEPFEAELRSHGIRSDRPQATRKQS
jgi:hypothetical protein